MMMALKASATARAPVPRPSSSPSPLRKTISLSDGVKRSQPIPSSVSLPTSSTFTLFALFAAPHEAKALGLAKEQIVSSLTQVEKTIDQVGEVGSNLFDLAKRVFQVVAETVKPGVDAALPILQQAGEVALKTASPTISEASKKAQEAIKGAGFDTEPVITAAKTVAGAAKQSTQVIEGAKPLVSSTIETISSADPISIVGAGGALFLAYLLFPPIWSIISFGLRGYKGDLTPAQALDLVSTKSHIMIDIRSEKDKNKAGIPRVPSSAKNRMIAIPLEELPSKLKSLVQNPKKLEAEIVALKISFLKKINKGSNIVIMDSYSDSAKKVARTLTSLGFKNCWIVADGFSGRKGWLQSRLGSESYGLAFPEVLSPSRVVPAAMQRLGTTSSAKLLPGSSD